MRACLRDDLRAKVNGASRAKPALPGARPARPAHTHTHRHLPRPGPSLTSLARPGGFPQNKVCAAHGPEVALVQAGPGARARARCRMGTSAHQICIRLAACTNRNERTSRAPRPTANPLLINLSSKQERRAKHFGVASCSRPGPAASGLPAPIPALKDGMNGNGTRGRGAHSRQPCRPNRDLPRTGSETAQEPSLR